MTNLDMFRTTPVCEKCGTLKIQRYFFKGDYVNTEWYCPVCEPTIKQEDMPIKLYGWICSKCGRVYSPYVQMCSYCGPTTFTVTNTNLHQDPSKE